MQNKRPFIFQQTTLETWAIGIGGLLLFTLGLWHQEFTGFETRFAVFAKEMLRLGISIFPKTYGEPYPDYPATSTLLIWLTSLPFGEVNKFTAIFPTALASAINLMLTYRLLSQVSRQWAFIAVCFELLTATFLVEARAISLDQMLATITLACFVLVYRKDNDTLIPLRSWLGILFLLAIGFSIRGPMGVVIPVGVMCSYYALTNQWRAVFKIGIPALAVLIACWFVLLFLAKVEGGESFVADVVRMQVTGRLSGSDDAPPGYYYLVNGLGNFALAFPFALVAMFVVVKTAWPHISIPVLKKTSHQESDAVLRMALLMAGWFIVILIGLSIPQTKKARYLLPAVPAIAALAALAFVTRRKKILSRQYQVLRILLLALPAFLILATLFASYRNKHEHLSLVFHNKILLLILFVCQFIQLYLAFKAKRSEARDKAIAVVAVVAFWSISVLLREPAEIQMHSARPFVEMVEALRQQTPAPLVMYGINKDGIAIVYHVNVGGEFKPRFINEPQELAKLDYPVYLLISDKNAIKLRAAASAQFQVEWPLPVYEGFFREGSYSVYYLEHSL